MHNVLHPMFLLKVAGQAFKSLETALRAVPRYGLDVVCSEDSLDQNKPA